MLKLKKSTKCSKMCKSKMLSECCKMSKSIKSSKCTKMSQCTKASECRKMSKSTKHSKCSKCLSSFLSVMKDCCTQSSLTFYGPRHFMRVNLDDIRDLDILVNLENVGFVGNKTCTMTATDGSLRALQNVQG